MAKKSNIKVESVKEGKVKTGIKVSLRHKSGNPSEWMAHELNQKVSVLLAKLAEELAKADEFEFYCVDEAMMNDDEISIVCNFFIP